MNIRDHAFFCLIGISVLLAGCDSKLPAITDCVASGDITPMCQFKNPEDIEVLPDQKSLLISQMGNMDGSKPGNLVVYDTVSGVISTLFPASIIEPSKAPDWGDKSCPGIPGDEFAPHGISLKQRDDGQLQLAVINHGGRDSVEMFSVQQDGGHWQLQWRGCVVPEDGTFMNDVALLGNGGFVATHMFDKRDPVFWGGSVGMLKAQFGVETGYVFEWQPDAGFRILEESRGPFLNGVEISPDNNTVYASVSAGREIRKLDRKTGKKLGAADVVHADNMTWDAAGQLLAVAAGGSISEQMDCLKTPGQTCGFEFTIYRINPDDMSSEVVFKHQGAPMGAGTVARQLGDFLYIGSFSSDRIVRVPYEKHARK
jgi:hypothetical protein